MLDWYPARWQTDAVHIVFLHTGGAEKKISEDRKGDKEKESPMSSDKIYLIVYDYNV